jgi:hypothetical protein
MEVVGSLCERGRLMPTHKAEAGTMKDRKNMKSEPDGTSADVGLPFKTFMPFRVKGMGS